MSHQTWQETLITAHGNGTALNTSVTATSILPAQAKYNMSSNYLDYIGKQIRVRAAGQMSNIATTPGTLQLSVKFGSTVVALSPAWALIASAKTNVSWFLDIAMHLRAEGSTANLLTIGSFQSESMQASAVANQASTVMWPLSAPAVGSNFDATVSQVVDLFAQWSVSNVGNSIQLMTYSLESLN